MKPKLSVVRALGRLIWVCTHPASKGKGFGTSVRAAYDDWLAARNTRELAVAFKTLGHVHLEWPRPAAYPTLCDVGHCSSYSVLGTGYCLAHQER